MKDIDFELIAKKLKEIRLSKGLTQEYVASAADVNTTHICNIENNRVKISLSTLIHVCNALDVTLDYVLSSEYANSTDSLDNEIIKELRTFSSEDKNRILRIIKAY